MKKISAFLLIFVLLFNTSSVLAVSDTSYFTNNKALDTTFEKLKKAFMASEQKDWPIEVDADVFKGKKSIKVPKMTDALIEKAVTKVLNDIKVYIEIEEERLGGLTKEDYEKISAQLIHGTIVSKGYLYWDKDMKYIILTFGIGGDEYEEFDNLTGNFANMGSVLDEVYTEDLEVKADIERYIKQSIQKGNKFSSEMVNKLPDRIDSLFKELQLTKILAAQTIAEIHRDIYACDLKKFDGSESLDSIIESYQSIIGMRQENRQELIKIKKFTFSNDEPSPEYRDYFADKIIDGELSEYFTSGFKKAITLDELARLYFESKEVDEKIVLDEGTIDQDAPDYIKNAFIYGMIDNAGDLNKPLNRLEAAKHLINGIIYQGSGVSKTLRIADCAKIQFDDLVTVANCLDNGIDTIGMNFEPEKMYTIEDAIMDKFRFEFNNIRGYEAPINISEPSKIVIGKNIIHMQFDSKEQVEEFIEYQFEDSAIGDIKRNGSYMRIDTGCALLEFFTPENGIKFTFKNGVKYIDFDKGTYGPELQFKIEPRILKSGEKADMNMQIDSIHKKINIKLDAILAKIIKPNMTTEQKVKAIHDYVVTHITYDSKYSDEETPETLLTTIDKGRGVCGDYTQLFQYLCDRAAIPCISEAGDVSTSSISHAWNVVFLNGQWKFVDTTWDDADPKKITYKYYLVDKFTFMKDHKALMGVPDENLCPEVDGMKIKSQDELRIYLLKKFYWIDGYKVTFRMADKKMKPNIGYIWPTSEIKVVLTYDSKNDLYTVAAKAR